MENPSRLPDFHPSSAVPSALRDEEEEEGDEEEEEGDEEPLGAEPELLAQLASLALQMPVTLPGGSLWLSSQLCCLWKGWEQRRPRSSPGIPTAGKHVNKSVRFVQVL